MLVARMILFRVIVVIIVVVVVVVVVVFPACSYRSRFAAAVPSSPE